MPANRCLWCDDQFNGKSLGDEGSWNGRYELEGDEALVFFLGGIASFVRDDSSLTLAQDSTPIQLYGFSTYPRNPSGVPSRDGADGMQISPIPNSDHRIEPMYDFAPGRLFVRGMLPAGSDVAGPAQDPVNDWLVSDGIRPPKLPSYRDTFSNDASPRPLAYFSSYEGQGYRPWDCAVPHPFGEDEDRIPFFQITYPYLTGSNTGIPHAESVLGPNPYTSSEPAPLADQDMVERSASVVQSFNAGTFQIISAGPDGRFGSGGQVGHRPMSTGDANFDNLSNFTEGVSIGAFNQRGLERQF